MTENKAIVPIKEGQLQPTDLEGLYRLSNIMANSGLVPNAYSTKTEMVFVACQMGMEIGLSPMASVQNIAVINGNPALYGDALLAIVSGSGILEDFEETFSGEIAKENFKCVCTAKRKDRKTPIIREFGVEDSKRAKLWNNKDVWKKYPKRMLQMRARALCLRDGFPDLLKGIRVAEEVQDYEPNDDFQEAEIIKEEVIKEEINISEYEECLAEKKNYPEDKLNDFITQTASTNNVSVDELKMEAGKNFEDFWENFRTWFIENKDK